MNLIISLCKDKRCENKIFVIIGFIIFTIAPFFFLYWLNPLFSPLTIGNDYGFLMTDLKSQFDLLFSIKMGSFPLFFPGFLDGISTAAISSAQLYHPISYIAFFLPWYWSGHALTVITILKLLSLGITHFFLFLILTRLRVPRVFSFLLSFITIYNLRMLDLFRFNFALESYVGFLWLCMSIILFWLKKNKFVYGLLISVSSYLLIVSGHPQMSFYGFLGAGILTLFLPLSLKDNNDLCERNLKIRFYFLIALFVFIGVLWSSCFTIPYLFDFLIQKPFRLRADFDWSNMYRNASVLGGLNTFFRPFDSDVHGSFSGSSLSALVITFPILFLSKNSRIPKALLMLWVIIFFIFLLSLGCLTPLYYYYWKFFPFVSFMRTPGRINMIVPVISLLIYVWLFRDGLKNLKHISFMVWVSFFLYIFYNLFMLKKSYLEDTYTPSHLNQIPYLWHASLFFIGTASFISFIIYSSLNIGKFKQASLLLFVICVILESTILLRYGTWITQRTLFISYNDRAESFKRHLKTTVNGEGDYSYGLTPFDLTEHRRKYKTSEYGEPLARLFFFENKIGPNEMADAKPKTNDSANIRLRYSSFNKLIFETSAPNPCHFYLPYPYSKHWKLKVDGRPSKIYRANERYQAVWLGSGVHTLEFRYWSWASFIGFGIFSITSIGCVIFLAISLIKMKLKRALFIIFCCLSLTLLFVAWTYSLHNGLNFGTNYYWTPSKDRSENFPVLS